MTPSDHYQPICFCGSLTEYRDSTDFYGGKGYGMRWICTRWPQCRGSVGAHPDGRPLGTVPDEETKKLRRKLHDIIDVRWKHLTGKERNRARYRTYVWLSNLTGIPFDDCHIGMFDKQLCERVLVAIQDEALRSTWNNAKHRKLARESYR